MKKIRIILADDHKVLRQGLCSLLEDQPDLQVIGEAGDGLQLLELLGENRPDVVLADLKMPNLNGLDALAQIQKRFPKIRTVILTMHDDLSYIERALHVGVCGYVLKDEDMVEVITAIRHAANNQHYLSPKVAAKAPPANLDTEKEADFSPLDALTNRERQVFQLVAEGKTNTQAAEMLGLSARTVEGHRSNFMKKLSLKNHVELAIFANKYGIIGSD
jgi:DNA-binding NarL/FixJ family response regulator